TAPLTGSATQDTFVEGPETFAPVLSPVTSNASVTTGTTATLHIADDDSATVSIATGISAAEGGGNGMVIATLNITTNGDPNNHTGTLASLVTARLPGNADYTSS